MGDRKVIEAAQARLRNVQNQMADIVFPIVLAFIFVLTGAVLCAMGAGRFPVLLMNTSAILSLATVAIPFRQALVVEIPAVLTAFRPPLS